MPYTFAKKDTVTTTVTFNDPFANYRQETFRATFVYKGRKEAEQITDWEAELRSSIVGWDIKGLDFSEEALDELLDNPEIAAALDRAIVDVRLGRKKSEMINDPALRGRLLASRVGN